MRRSRRYRQNPNWAGMVQSLLRLGDVSRNSQLGEVEAALEKARALIEKYGLSSFATEYDRMLDKLQRFKRGEHVEATHTSSGRQQRQQSSSGSTRRKEQEEAYRQWYQEWKRRKEAYRQWYQEWKRRKEEEFTRRWSGGRTREQEDEARRKRKADSRSARTAARREARKAWVKPPYDVQIKWTYAHWVGQYDRFPPRGFGGKMGWQRYEAAVKANATTVRDAYHAGVKWRDLRRWETGRYIVLERG